MGAMFGRHGEAMVGGHGGLLPQITALEDAQDQIQVAATVSALPEPATLEDGTLAAVMAASDNGEAALYVVRDGEWKLPLQAFRPTISFVTLVGGGTGELPEDVVVGEGATVPLGTGWVLTEPQTVARPSGIAVLPVDPASIELGANGAGLWRIAVQLRYDSPGSAAAIMTDFKLQSDTGSGFADVVNGELMNLAQDAPAALAGISQVGLLLNLLLVAGEKLRVVVTHDASGSRTYTIHSFAFAMNQIAATPT